MIDMQTLDRLKAMRLSGMAEYFENLGAATGAQRLTGPEMVKMAVDWEYERRRNSKLHRLRRHAALAQPAADIADIKAMPARNVDAELIARLAVGNYLQNRQDVILQGPTGAGKTYVACALGNKACQQYVPCSTCRLVNCSTGSPSPNAPGSGNAAWTPWSRWSC
jgi:DNA replication protein DnaC